MHQAPNHAYNDNGVGGNLSHLFQKEKKELKYSNYCVIEINLYYSTRHLSFKNFFMFEFKILQ